MSSGRYKRGSSRHSAGMLLRVRRPGGPAEEIYLASGLTIGRSVANGIVLADDNAVDRTHARVEVADDGSARLRCVEPGGMLTVDGMAVRELTLDAGVRFQVGRAEFECVSGRGAEGYSPRTRSTCPFCGSTAVPTTGADARPCPDCNNPVLPIPPDPHAPDPVLVPAAYGSYRVDRYAARGGMGLVLRGTREGGGEPVAIKVLLPGTILDHRDAGRFEHEVVMLARVRHPNVVKMLDHGMVGRCPYLVLEWIEGPSLREVIAKDRRAGKLTDFVDALRWFEQVAKGLAAIHAVGMVHRDLKPSNLLIGPDGVARVADLGIAKRIDAGHTSYTTTGHAPGTFEYMAPEQIAAPDTVDGRADLYALGVTFHELLAGTRPVGAWRPASEVNPTVPKSFDAVLGRLLAPRPSDRYGDIHDLLCAFSNPGRAKVADGETHLGEGQTCRPKPDTPGVAADLLDFPSPVRLLARSARNWALSGASALGGVSVLSCLSVALARRLGWFQGDGRAWELAGGLIQTTIWTVMGAVGGSIIWALDRSVPKLNRYVLLGLTAGLILGWSVSGSFPMGLFVFGPVTGLLAIIGRLCLLSAERDAETYLLWSNKGCDGLDTLVACLTQALRLDPRLATTEFFMKRGLIHWERNDVVRAIADFSEIIRLEPEAAEAYCHRAIAWFSFDEEKALADYNDAIRLRPGWAQPYAGRGSLLMLSAGGANAEAIADFNEAIRLGYRSVDLFIDRAQCYGDLGDHEHAIADCTEAISMKPDEPLWYQFRANAHEANGEPGKAEADRARSQDLKKT